MPGQTDTDTPTTRRIMLGGQLRQRREEAGITREEAAYLIRGSVSKLSRMERGRVQLKRRDVQDLLQLYGVADVTEQDAALSLLTESNTPAWWEHYNLEFPDWFKTYVGMEQSAAAIFTYEPMFLPGLLQTEDYARTLVTGGLPNADTETVEQWVKLRMQRQQMLDRDEPTELHAIVDESVFYRTVSDAEVQRQQWQHMLDMAERTNITFQVSPLKLDIWASHAGPFVRLAFAAEDVHGVVYLEGLTGGLFVDKPQLVAQYDAVTERIKQSALSPADSAERVRQSINAL